MCERFRERTWCALRWEDVASDRWFNKDFYSKQHEHFVILIDGIQLFCVFFIYLLNSTSGIPLTNSCFSRMAEHAPGLPSSWILQVRWSTEPILLTSSVTSFGDVIRSTQRNSTSLRKSKTGIGGVDSSSSIRTCMMLTNGEAVSGWHCIWLREKEASEGELLIYWCVRAREWLT